MADISQHLRGLKAQKEAERAEQKVRRSFLFETLKRESLRQWVCPSLAGVLAPDPTPYLPWLVLLFAC